MNHLLLYLTTVQNMEVVTSLQIELDDSAVAIGHDIPQVSGIPIGLGSLQGVTKFIVQELLKLLSHSICGAFYSVCYVFITMNIVSMTTLSFLVCWLAIKV